jgi:uncharacterized protein YciU (UPF0263 family)
MFDYNFFMELTGENLSTTTVVVLMVLFNATGASIGSL